MTYYISGPMTGIENHNKPAFLAAEARLTRPGRVAISPFDLSMRVEEYRALLSRDIAYLFNWADALYMLKGWEHSPGARAEHAVAVALELPIAYEGEYKLKEMGWCRSCDVGLDECDAYRYDADGDLLCYDCHRKEEASLASARRGGA